jgi:hypothetical protein
MRNGISKIAWHVFVAMIAIAVGGNSAARGESVRNPPRPDAVSVPSSAVLLMLVRSTVAALNQANFTGNYTVLHGLGTPELQTIRSPADWAVAFKSLRERKLDLSPVLLLEPQFAELPAITRDGALRVAGTFRTQPVGISFVGVYRPVLGIWRIEELSVSAEPVRQIPQPAVPQPARMKGSTLE